jgi:hypothetical protein
MKPLKLFEEFVKQGIVKKQAPNLERAESLVKEAEDKKIFFEKIIKQFSLEDTPPNYIIETSYDILIELIRAKLFIDGFNSSNSHEAEVSYMRNLKFDDEDIKFMDSLRYFRNGIKYYGRMFDKEYSLKTYEFLIKLYPKIKRLIK